MSGLLACIQKDIRLLIGNGRRTFSMLLFMTLLIVAILFGMVDVADRRTQVTSFSIAIRDLDDTIMSRILIDQIKNIDLFDNVYLVENKSDELLFAEFNVAAVMTLPHNFFYSLYDMRNYTIDISLNGQMPLESSIFQSLILSIMDIISENQQMTWVVHRLKFGELDSTRMNELYQQASMMIIQDALGRQGVFEVARTVTDDITNRIIFLYSSIISMFLMFIPLCILKTLPEELRIGILPRYKVKGGSLAGFILSKGLAAFLVCLPVWLLLTFTLLPLSPGFALLMFTLCYLAAFTLFLLISILVKDPAQSQLIGNIVLILFMLVGGGLYPLQLLPSSMQMFSQFTIPYYFIMSLTSLSMGFDAKSIITLLYPIMGFTIVGLLLVSLTLKGKNTYNNL